MPSRIDLSAAEIGRFARAALAAGRCGKVIAAFERSFYVETDAGLACIGADSLRNGPLNVLLRAMPVTPAVGETVACDDAGAAFDSGLRIALASALPWRPPQPALRRRSLLNASLAQLRRQCAARIPADGFGFLIAGPSKARPLSGALPAVRAYAGWLKRLLGARQAAAPRSVAALIGLGPGLTPAGDDLIGGSLLALHAWRRKAVAERIARWALGIAADRTGKISRAHLACAANGEAGAALHALLCAVIAGAADFGREIDAIEAIGHTSGWDAAAGAMLALSALAYPAGGA